MSALSALLDTYRSASVTEREKGTYFEELICAYLRNEATYRDLYDKVWMYGDWAKEQGNPRYIIDLLESVITVSIETMKIVNSLPDISEDLN